MSCSSSSFQVTYIHLSSSTSIPDSIIVLKSIKHVDFNMKKIKMIAFLAILCDFFGMVK